MTQIQETNPPLMMTANQIMFDMQISRQTLDRLVKRGDLPKPYKLRHLRWLRSEVMASIARTR